MPTGSTTTVKLDAQTKARLRRLAAARRRSAHWLMNEAVGQYLEREEPREQLRQDALASWRVYEATGLHATEDEVDDWLGKLAKGENSPPPRAHH